MNALSVELVPAQQWGSNLRSALRPCKWDILRRAAYAKAGGKCEVCGGSGLNQGRRHALEAHEIWDYDAETFTQKLTGIIALCPRCHEVKHIGRAFMVGNGERALKHLARVNGWRYVEARQHIGEAFDIHAERSAYAWTLDLTWLFCDESPFNHGDHIFRK